jgi:hypothetical protein
LAGEGENDARLAVDIVGEERRWLFVAETPAEVSVSLWPPPAEREREALERGLRLAFGEQALVKYAESPFADSRDEALLSVNEEV